MIKATDKEIVDEQLRPLWGLVAATAFDSDRGLAVKQQRLNELTAWAHNTPDRFIRAHRHGWIDIAQHTVTYEKQKREKQRDAKERSAMLSPLPRFTV